MKFLLNYNWHTNSKQAINYIYSENGQILHK